MSTDSGKPERPAIPFFVGVGRSGTTLLRAIFDAHSQLAVVNESRFASWMAHRVGRNGEPFDRARFVGDLFDTRRVASRVPTWGISQEEMSARLERQDPRDLADAMRCVFGAYAAQHGKTRYGDKTPRYVQHLDVIASLFDEARFVHLVRDGRDVATAVMSVDFGAASVTHAARRWARRVAEADAVGARLGPSRYRSVRYEDLVGDTEGIVRDLCGFLGLDFEPAMLRYFEDPAKVYAGLEGQNHHERLRLPVSAGLRDWHNEMSSKDVARFEAVAGDVLAQHGYPVVSEGPLSLSDRAGAALDAVRGRATASLRGQLRKRRSR